MRNFNRKDTMKVVTTLEELWEARRALTGTLGFVPTMGYLHDGHLSLVRCAQRDCDHTAVSIFVNPTQFAPTEDLDAYPRDLARDLRLLEEAGVALVWTPTAEVMYPPDYQTWVTVEKITQPLEGARRPGHFRGVTTVVSKLFNAVRPDKAYFGQKDAQQAAVIRRMTLDLSYPIDIVVCPIRREADGLAMSSRNTYLSPEEREAATVLYRALKAAEAAYRAGERSAETLRRIMRDTILAEPLAELQYVSCADYDSLEELQFVEGKVLLSMAVYIGKTRLIDNLVLGA